MRNDQNETIRLADGTSRRAFLGASIAGIAGAFASSHMFAETPKPSVFNATELNHVSLDITHPERSLEFYQSLFGMTPVQHGRGSDNFLHFEKGFLNLRQADTAGMNHFCLSIRDFDAEYAYGLMRLMELEPFLRGGGNLLHVNDPDGINVQVQEEGHGWRRTSGDLANADKGTFHTVRLHHVSLNVTNIARSRDFYVEMFGLKVVEDGDSDSHCLLQVGDAGFVELNRAEKPGMKNYGYAIKDFDLDKATEQLKKFGVANANKLKTNSVEFQDPQNILVQLTSEGSQ
jgi:catechol 2,3-dioxygenase-like lactoylglutathione lyase family enzyme